MAALKEFSTGEDISFEFKRLISGTTDQYRNLDNYTDIIIYVENGKRTIKFAKVAKTGYTTLTRVDAYTLTVKLSSEDTRTLGTGNIKVNSNFVAEDLTVEDERLNRIAGGVAFRLVHEKIGEEN